MSVFLLVTFDPEALRPVVASRRIRHPGRFDLSSHLVVFDPQTSSTFNLIQFFFLRPPCVQLAPASVSWQDAFNFLRHFISKFHFLYECYKGRLLLPHVFPSQFVRNFLPPQEVYFLRSLSRGETHLWHQLEGAATVDGRGVFSVMVKS